MIMMWHTNFNKLNLNSVKAASIWHGRFIEFNHCDAPPNTAGIAVRPASANPQNPPTFADITNMKDSYVEHDSLFIRRVGHIHKLQMSFLKPLTLFLTELQ
jgi:hypothetical protein